LRCIPRGVAQRLAPRRREKFDDVKYVVMQIPCDKLVNLIEHQEPNMGPDKPARGGKEGMKFLRSSADDVRHILLQEATLVREVVVGKS